MRRSAEIDWDGVAHNFVATPDLISIAACMHARRDPRRWEESVGG
jgi:hypothetical protein